MLIFKQNRNVVQLYQECKVLLSSVLYKIVLNLREHSIPKIKVIWEILPQIHYNILIIFAFSEFWST